MATGISVSAYARSRRERGLPGGSRWGVQKAIREGRIVKEEDGTIDPERADRMWDANTSEAKRHGDPAPATYQEARAIREALNARLTKLEYEERLGELVRASDVRKQAFEVGRTLRNRLLAVPGRLAASLAAETSPKRVEQLLVGELRRALEEVGVS